MLKRRRIVYLLLIAVSVTALLAALSVSGCGTKEEPPENGENGKQAEEQVIAPRSITTEVGKEFEVDLESNPSTGYEWTLAEEPDKKLLAQLWEDTYTHDLKPGAPAIQVFNFKALAVGSTDLEFEYSRPWETDVAPEKTWTVSVKINEGNQEPTRDYTDPKTPIDVKKGEDFQIVLESNPSTGYSWELAEELDTSILRPETTYFETSKVGAEGAPGNEYWLFDTLEAGSTKISFKYVRPWEGDVEPEKTAVFTVNVAE